MPDLYGRNFLNQGNQQGYQPQGHPNYLSGGINQGGGQPYGGFSQPQPFQQGQFPQQGGFDPFSIGQQYGNSGFGGVQQQQFQQPNFLNGSYGLNQPRR